MLITLLNAGSNCDVLMRQKKLKVVISDAKTVRCMFGLCWRFVVALPPPFAFLRDMKENLSHELQVNSIYIVC